MTANNYAPCLKIILQSEGGFNPNDGTGVGATEMGITQKTLSGWLGRTATAADVKALTVATVSQIYLSDYWNVIDANVIPTGLDLMCFDEAVNQGPARAIRTLQTALGTPADGRLGPVTLAALAACNASKMIDRVVSLRSDLYHQASEWGAYGAAWMARLYRTAADAHAMVGAVTATSVSPDPVVEPQPQPIEPARANDLGIPPLPPIIPAPLPIKPTTKPKVTPTVAGVTVGIGAVAATTAVIVGAPHMSFVNLAPILDPAIQVAGLVLTGIAAWLAPLLATRIGVSTQSALMQNLLGAVDRGISYGQQQATSLVAQDANVSASNATQQLALSYVVQKMPDTITKLGMTPQHVSDLILAKLPTGTAQ